MTAAAGGAAALLLTGAPRALADTTPPPPDAVRTELHVGRPVTSDGSLLDVWMSIYRVSGDPDLDFLLLLPPGLTYYGVEGTGDEPCVPSADGRRVTCRAGAGHPGSRDLDLKVGDNVPVGTVLDVTMRPVHDFPDDPDQSDNSQTVSATVQPKSDWSVRWSGPKDPVEPGRTVTTRLMVINNGPDEYDDNDVVMSTLAADGSAWPQDVKLVAPTPGGCTDTGHGRVCGLIHSYWSYYSQTYTFLWKIPESARGRTLKLTAFTRLPDRAPANDRATLTVRVAGAPTTPPPTSPPTTTPAPPTSPTTSASATSTPPAPGSSATTASNAPVPQGSSSPSASSRSGGNLAATGAGATKPLLATAAGAAALGTVFAWGWRRRHAGQHR